MLLALTALLLIAVIAYQNYATPALRNETISDGLYPTVPSHWLLVTAYALLSTALVLEFSDVSPASFAVTIAISISLFITAFTNTYFAWVDKVTGGKHSQIHTSATEVMFILMIALECINDHGWLTWVTVAGIALPLITAGVMSALKTKLLAGPVAEKLAVFGLCAWMIAWSLYS